MAQVQLWPLVSSTLSQGSSPQVVAYGPMLGGFVYNPVTPQDQGLATLENLFISLVGDAQLGATNTTTVLFPGDTYKIPANFAGRVSVNAITSGHRFAGVIYQDAANFQPSQAPFPPSGPTTLYKTLPSYLYEQYNDDEDLLAFVDSYNALAQEYVTWFATIGLPVYVSPQINSTLLDWVIQGLYGILRPSLPSGTNQNIGGFNTYLFNQLPFNEEIIIGPPDYFLTNDDVFKRIVTWGAYKGDGRYFDIGLLKRRVVRFLTGINGTEGDTSNTYQVSVTFGPDGEVNINLQTIRRIALRGALFGTGTFNTSPFNDLQTTAVMIPQSPLVAIFKAAVEAGVLELPFQFTWTININ